MGSDDSDEEDSEGDDDYDYEDGFLVEDEANEEDEENEEDAEYSSSDEEIFVRRRKEKATRIIAIAQTSSDESDVDADSNGANVDETEANEVISISVQAASVVVFEGNSPNAAEIVEGKKFATTFLNPEEESEEKHTTSSVSRKSITEPAQKETISEKENEEDQTQSAATVNTELEHEITEEKGEKEEKDEKDEKEEKKNQANASIAADESIESEAVENESAELSDNESIDLAANSEHDTEINDVEAENIDKNESLPQSNSVSVEPNGKENELAIKKIPKKSNRNSLPDTVRLSKAATSKTRVSLGDLSIHRQRINEALPQRNSPAVKKNANEATVEPTAAVEDVVTDYDKLNASASSSNEENMSPNDYKNVPLDISSQEENNNQKSSAKKGLFI